MSEDALAEGRPAEVLLVDDNENDVELTRRAFKRAKFSVNLQRASDGMECMALLRKEGTFADAATPDLILLDLKMPRMDGREVLMEIAKDESLRHLPVVVLTSSSAEEDILKSYKLRCSSYLVKPITFDGFAKVIQSLGNYWFSLVVLPPKVRSNKAEAAGEDDLATSRSGRL